MAKNNVFVGKGYCNQRLFTLNVLDIINNENDSSSSAYLLDSIDLWYCGLDHIKMSYIKKMKEL